MAQIVKLRRSSISGQKPTNTNLQLGELALNTTDGKVFMAVSGSLGPTVEELISTNTVNTGAINLIGDITASGLRINGDAVVSSSMYIGTGVGDFLNIKAVISSSLLPDSDGDHHNVGIPNRRWKSVHAATGAFNTLTGFSGGTLNINDAVITGSFTGSFKGDATYLTNVPFHITGSDISGNTVDKQFTKLQFDDSTGLNVEETDSGTAFISIGSHFKDIFVSGSPLLSATGSDAFEIIPSDGIVITTSITDTNGNGYVKELNISAASLSSSLNNRINTITGSIDSLNNFSSSVVLTSQTGSMTVMSASYATTAAFALNAGGGAEGRTAQLVQSSAATTWTFNHNLGEQYPTVTIYDNNDFVVIPTSIEAVTSNQLSITFPSAQSGIAVATVGGGLPYLSGSYDGYVLAGVSNAPTWKGGIISGSLQIENFGFAITGSNTFVGDQIIAGTLNLHEAQIKQFTISGVTVGSYTITSIASGVYDAGFFDYVLKDGTNMRAGSVSAVWDGTTIKYNEVTTNDIGDTSAVVLSVNISSGNANLRATISSGTWTFKTLVRGL